MSTSRFHLIPRRHLPNEVHKPLLSLMAAATFLLPAASSADCCGGSGGKGGIPPIESFAQNSRVSLQIFPGERNQQVEIFNAQTGVRIATVPFGGTSGQNPIGIVAPDTGGTPVTYSISDTSTQESGTSGSGREITNDSIGDGSGSCLLYTSPSPRD